MMTETLQMLTPKEVARILGVHQKTVHLWLRNGKLNGVKISYRAWRIPRSALDDFIEKNSNGMPQMERENQQGTEIRDSLPFDASPVLSIDCPDSAQAKMKHYLRDIMGEKSPGKNPE